MAGSGLRRAGDGGAGPRAEGHEPAGVHAEAIRGEQQPPDPSARLSPGAHGHRVQAAKFLGEQRGGGEGEDRI